MAKVVLPALTAALQSIGNAQLYIGSFDGDTPGVAPIAIREGDTQVQHNPNYNDLTAPELTGPVIHQRSLEGENLVVTIPLIVPADSAEFWAAVSPTASAGGGYSYPQKVAETQAALIPDNEIGGGLEWDALSEQWDRAAGNGIPAASAAAAAPKNAIWFWRCTLSAPARTFRHADGGKMIVPVTIQCLFAAAYPEGHKLYTIGDPDAAGITTSPGFGFQPAA